MEDQSKRDDSADKEDTDGELAAAQQLAEKPLATLPTVMPQ